MGWCRDMAWFLLGVEHPARRATLRDVRRQRIVSDAAVDIEASEEGPETSTATR